MKTIEQVSRGIANFYDAEVRSTLPGAKGILYGVAIGRAASNVSQLIEQYASILLPLGIVKEGQVDVEGLAADIKEQMGKSGGTLKVRVLNDEFSFVPADVDALVYQIERA